MRKVICIHMVEVEKIIKKQYGGWIRVKIIKLPDSHVRSLGLWFVLNFDYILTNVPRNARGIVVSSSWNFSLRNIFLGRSENKPN